MKILSFDEILNFYQIYLDTTSKEVGVNKNSYIQKSTLYKKPIVSGTSPSINFLNFLNNFQLDVNQSSATPMKETIGIGGTNQKYYSNRKSVGNNPTSSSSYLNSLSNLSKLVQNKHQNNSSNTQNIFNTRLTNLCELVNKSIKENLKEPNKENLKENQQHHYANSSEKVKEGNSNMPNNNLLISAGTNPNNSFLSNNYLNNLFTETNISKNVKKTSSGGFNPGLVEIITFFVDNNLNFQGFCELILYLQNNFLKEQKFKSRYQIALIKTNRSHYIQRHPNTVYDINLSPKSYFLILEGEDSKLKSFFEDKKFVIDTLNKLIISEGELNNYINKKIQDLSEKLDKQVISHQVKNTNLSINFSLKENKKIILFKSKVLRILPEGVQHGLLTINTIYTNEQGVNKKELKEIEFIPMTNNYKNRSLHFQLSKVQGVMPYRYLYKNRGLNIFLYQSLRSKIFIFENETDYNYLLSFLNDKNNCVNLMPHFADLDYHTNLWTKGLMSNYDYILYLNFMGSRSFSDLSQYPVFPWILINFDEETEELDISEEKNYRDLSKPIGQLNPEKCEKINKKYIDMCVNYSSSEPPYLYGKHYSTPAYVIYFLTRSAPEFQLQIQNGSFGPADRMFNSVRDCWDFIFSNPMGNEVMELIPEFFQSSGEFLINIHNIQAGKTKSSETLIPHVQLPKWAKSPQKFISIMRAALESDYVSLNINQWIDLIFGDKQRGEKAGNYYNLFYHITYDDYNYDDFPDDKKFATFSQILQFGQTPKQLFLNEHPKKNSLDILGYQIISNPSDMIETIEKYKKENDKIENNFKKNIEAKFMDKQRLITEYKEIEKERNEKLDVLKESLREREDSHKRKIEKLIEHNEQLKDNFENFDSNKDKFYQEMIESLTRNHENDIKKKYSNQSNLCKYIKDLETSINRHKIIEKEKNKEVENLKDQLDKQSLVNEELSRQINLLKNKLNKIPKNKIEHESEIPR